MPISIFPNYIHVVNPKLKHIYLTFNDEGVLIIKSPKVSQKEIEQLLIKKSSWINSASKRFEEKKGKSVNFKIEPKLYFLGKPYTLELVQHDKKRTKLLFDGYLFKLYYCTYDEVIFQRHIDSFYKEEMKNYIPHLVKKWSKIMNVEVNKITFRKTKRQWGSCSIKNDLSFNTMMMKLPLDAMEYIVIHELAHIKHKHHKKAFWDFVAQYLPEYKMQVKELKNFTT